MVLQICAHALAVGHNRDAQVRKLGRITDARQHQDLGRIDRRGRNDDLSAGADHLDSACALDLDADGAALLRSFAAGQDGTAQLRSAKRAELLDDMVADECRMPWERRYPRR